MSKLPAKVFLLSLVVVLAFLPLHAAQAALVVTAPGGVTMVDGSGDGNVVPFAIEFAVGVNSLPFDFGHVDNMGVFQSILTVPSLTGPFGFGSTSVSGTTTFLAGQVVDFALSNGTDVFSISDPLVDYADLTFDTPITGGVPDPYYNSLTINWNSANIGPGLPGLFTTATFLNAGGNADGFAPVPIPPAALLFGSGLIGLIGIARRSLFAK